MDWALNLGSDAPGTSQNICIHKYNININRSDSGILGQPENDPIFSGKYLPEPVPKVNNPDPNSYFFESVSSRVSGRVGFCQP